MQNITIDHSQRMASGTDDAGARLASGDQNSQPLRVVTRGSIGGENEPSRPPRTVYSGGQSTQQGFQRWPNTFQNPRQYSTMGQDINDSFNQSWNLPASIPRPSRQNHQAWSSSNFQSINGQRREPVVSSLPNQHCTDGQRYLNDHMRQRHQSHANLHYPAITPAALYYLYTPQSHYHLSYNNGYNHNYHAGSYLTGESFDPRAYPSPSNYYMALGLNPYHPAQYDFHRYYGYPVYVGHGPSVLVPTNMQEYQTVASPNNAPSNSNMTYFQYEDHVPISMHHENPWMMASNPSSSTVTTETGNPHQIRSLADPRLRLPANSVRSPYNSHQAYRQEPTYRSSVREQPRVYDNLNIGRNAIFESSGIDDQPIDLSTRGRVSYSDYIRRVVQREMSARQQTRGAQGHSVPPELPTVHDEILLKDNLPDENVIGETTEKNDNKDNMKAIQKKKDK